MVKQNDYYEIDGVRCDRVTRIINTVLRNTEVEDWQAKKGYEEAKEYTRQQQEIGLIVHDYIAQIESGFTFNESPKTKLEWELLAQEIKNSLIAWGQCKLYFKPKVIATELRIFDLDIKVAGTTDSKVRVNKELELWDWKTGGIRDPKTQKPYLEILFQGATYFTLHNKMFPDNQVRRFRAIQLPKKRGYWTQKDQLILEADAVPFWFEGFLGLFAAYKCLGGTK